VQKWFYQITLRFDCFEHGLNLLREWIGLFCNQWLLGWSGFSRGYRIGCSEIFRSGFFLGLLLWVRLGVKFWLKSSLRLQGWFESYRNRFCCTGNLCNGFCLCLLLLIRLCLRLRLRSNLLFWLRGWFDDCCINGGNWTARLNLRNDFREWFGGSFGCRLGGRSGRGYGFSGGADILRIGLIGQYCFNFQRFFWSVKKTVLFYRFDGSGLRMP